ncbi:Protein osb1, mitochondrial-like [Asimina triloba]
MATIFHRRNTRFCIFSSLRFLSTSSSAAGDSVASKYSSFSVDRDGRSPAYRRALQCQPPETIKRYKIASDNSASLIGTIVIPARRFERRNGDFCVFSVLEIKSRSPFRVRKKDGTSVDLVVLKIELWKHGFTSQNLKADMETRSLPCLKIWATPNPLWMSFHRAEPIKNITKIVLIMLQMQDEMANIALEHLRPNDSVYVLGHLSSYTKVIDNGRSEIIYKVVVNELNFIKDNSQVQTCKTAVEREREGKAKPISDPLNSENERDRLHQWQVFFANPHEWWDNRKEKGYKRFPDFKHKDTRECLSLGPDDPPWVRKQLELLDSKLEEQGSMGPSSRRSHRMSVWEYDEKAWFN